MKHISILVPKGEAILSSIVGPYKVFNSLNQYLIRSGLRTHKAFDVQLVGLTNETILYDGAFSIHPTKTINQIEKTDLIIIGTINGDPRKEIESNYDFIPWMLDQRLRNNTEIASLCSSAFLLAETGLLDGKMCTTHWSARDAFKQMYPQINLLTDKIITDEDGIYTSGGAYSFLNLVLYLVEKYSGREAALWCSKMFEIEFNRESQNQFTIFRGQKEHDDEPIKDAQQYIENNFGKRISVEKLATMFALSRRNFVRRFKKATSNAPLEYIQRVKIEAAKKSLETSQANVSEVMYSVGYNDNKAFRLIFRKYTGLSPKEYRNRYNRDNIYRIA